MATRREFMGAVVLSTLSLTACDQQPEPNKIPHYNINDFLTKPCPVEIKELELSGFVTFAEIPREINKQIIVNNRDLFPPGTNLYTYAVYENPDIDSPHISSFYIAQQPLFTKPFKDKLNIKGSFDSIQVNGATQCILNIHSASI